MSESAVLPLPDDGTLADLTTFVGRGHRIDPDGAARLSVHGDILVVMVSPLHAGGGPVVMGMRAMRLAADAFVAGAAVDAVGLGAVGLDAVVRLGALVAALERAAVAGRPEVVVPAEDVGASWAGTSPPRSGWAKVGEVAGGLLAERAAAGIAEIVAGAGPGSGSAAVATLRTRVWGRPLIGSEPSLVGLPAGVAFAVEALGFAGDDRPAEVYRNRVWWRVTTQRGHVLARPPALSLLG